MYDFNPAGVARYWNETLKQGTYYINEDPTTLEAGLLVSYANPVVNSVTMQLAAENGSCDGVLGQGSRDTQAGVYNVAYTSNVDAIEVLVSDGVFISTGDTVYAAAGGRITNVTPTSSYYVIGVATGPSKDTTLCDGTTAQCAPVRLQQVREFVDIVTPPKKSSNKDN